MEFTNQVRRLIDGDINSWLSKYDKDGDRNVSFEEVLEAFTDKKVKNPTRAAMAVFSSVDKDKDGIISIDEIKKNSYKINEGQIKAWAIKEVEKIFTENDIDGDKLITKDEMTNATMKAFKLTDRELAEMDTDWYFDLVDTDHDGKLTKEEILAYMNKSIDQPRQ